MTSGSVGLTETISDYAATVAYDPLPERVSFRAKCVIFDELSCSVLGRSLPAGQMIASYVEGQGGHQQATVTGSRLRTTASMAALANATAGHADELDGAHLTEGHPGASIVAGCLAVGEHRHASGKDYLTAVVLGYDIGTRLVDLVGGRLRLLSERHLHSDFLHAFGVSCGTGALLGLDRDQHRHGLALAACQTISIAAFFEEREHLSKSVTYGHIASSGVTAAELAELGFEGNDAVMESEHGVIAAYADGRDPGTLFDDLGSYYSIADSNFKFYSAGYPIHSPIEASLGLMRDHSLESTDIAEIDVKMNTNCVRTVDSRQMATICLQDMLPVAMALGKLGFKEAHSVENLRLPEVERLRDGIVLGVDAEMDRTHPRGRCASVELTLTDGRTLDRYVEWPYGHCKRADVTWEELEDKAHDMLDDLIGAEAVESLSRTVAELESVEDVSVLGSAVAGDVFS